MIGEKKDQFRKEMVKFAQGIVVEIGFGSGLNLPYYEGVSKLYAVDPSEAMFNLAEERLKSFRFPFEYIQGSAEHIALADASIDNVVSTWSLCSIPNLDLALSEVKRILKPGGKFIFIEHGLSKNPRIKFAQKCWSKVSTLLPHGCKFDRNFEEIIRKAGFNILSLKNYTPRTKPLEYQYIGIAER